MKKVTRLARLEEAKILRRQARLSMRKSARIIVALREHILKTVKMSKAKPRSSAKQWQKHIQMGRQLQNAAESLAREANRLAKKRARLPLSVRKRFDL